MTRQPLWMRVTGPRLPFIRPKAWRIVASETFAELRYRCPTAPDKHEYGSATRRLSHGLFSLSERENA